MVVPARSWPRRSSVNIEILLSMRRRTGPPRDSVWRTKNAMTRRHILAKEKTAYLKQCSCHTISLLPWMCRNSIDPFSSNDVHHYLVPGIGYQWLYDESETSRVQVSLYRNDFSSRSFRQHSSPRDDPTPEEGARSFSNNNLAGSWLLCKVNQ